MLKNSQSSIKSTQIKPAEEENLSSACELSAEEAESILSETTPAEIIKQLKDNS